MTADVIFSGLVGEAHVFDGATWSRVSADGARAASDEREVRWMLGLDPAAVYGSADVDPAEALRRAQREERAVAFTTGCLDADLGHDLRVRLSRRVERDLSDTDFGNFLLDRFLGLPAPESADFAGALLAAMEADAHLLAELWTEAIAAQPALVALASSFDEANEATSHTEREDLRAKAMRCDVLRRLVTALGGPGQGRIVLDLAREMPSRAPVIHAWVNLAAKRLGLEKPSAAMGLGRMLASDEELRAAVTTSPAGPALRASEVAAARRQAIELLRGGSVEAARSLVARLVAAQVRAGQAEFAAKTLCSIAAAARATPDVAEEWLRRALVVAPHDPVPAVQLVTLLRLRGRGREAALCADEVFLGRANDVIALCAWAEARRSGGDLDGSERKFREAQALAPLEGDAWTGFAELLRGRGRFDEAEAAYRKAQALSPHNEIAWNGFAELMRVRGRFDEAEAAYRKSQALAPHNEITWSGFAELMRVRGRFDEAEAAYRHAQALAPHNAVAWNGFAELMRNRGRFDDAEGAYRKAQALAPHDAIVWSGFAELMRARGRFDEAEAAHRKAQALAPHNEITWTGFAELMRARGRFDEADAAYRNAQALAPHNAVAWNGFAELMRERGRFDDAEEAYRKAQALAPHDAFAWTGFAELMRARGRLDEAEAAYRKAQALAPHNEITWTGFAELMRALGRFDEAEAAYRNAQALSPHNEIAWNGFAELMRERGRFDHAEGAYRKAQTLTPHIEIAWTGFAELMRARGRLDEAEAAYRQAQALAPHNEITWTGFAELMRVRGRLDEAEAAYRQAQALAPHNETAWTGFAELMRANGRLDEAEAAYRTAQALAPHHTHSRLGLALLLESRGGAVEADRLLALAGAPRHEGEWHLLRGQMIVALRRGQFSRARSLAESALVDCPFVFMRSVFSAILASVYIREHRESEAIRLLATPEVDPKLESTRRVLLLHAYASANDPRAMQESQALPTAGRAEIISLRDVLIGRYGLGHGRPDPSLDLRAKELEEELLAG